MHVSTSHMPVPTHNSSK